MLFDALGAYFKMAVFSVITYIMVAAALVLNSLGVYLLTLVKSSGNNQNVLLIHLSCIKIVVSLTESILCTLELLNRGYDFKEYQVFDTINAGLYGVNDLIVVTLTTDRLIASLKPLTYNAHVTQVKIKMAIACCWLIGTCGIIPFFFLQYDLLYEIYYKIVFLSLDAVVLLTAFVTYGTILKKLLSRHNSLTTISGAMRSTIKPSNSQTRVARKSATYGRFFYVSGLIILSFILFVSIPDAVYVAMVIINGNEEPIVESSIGFVWSMYLVTDPLIYIFLQRPIRLKLKRILFGRKVDATSFSAMTIRNERVATSPYIIRQSK